MVRRTSDRCRSGCRVLGSGVVGMPGRDKTREQLLEELAAAQAEIAELRRDAGARAERVEDRVFRAVFRQHEATMLLVDADTGRIAAANPAAQRFYGYSGDELRGMTIQEINVLAPEAVAENRAKADSREQGVFIFPHRLASGEVRTVEVHSSPILVGGQRLLFSVIHDISERVRVQEALHEETTFNRDVLDSIPDTIVVFDPSAGKAIRWNRAFREVSGFTDDEIAARPAPAGWYDEDELPGAGQVNEAIRSESGVRVELALLTKDGRKVPTEYVARTLERGEGRAPYAVSIGRDVTERKRVETALRESEEKFRAVFGQVHAGIAILDTNTGRFLEINDSYCRIVGYSEAEMLALDFQSVTHPDDLQQDLDQMEALRQGRISGFEMEKRYFKKTGEIVWVILTVALLSREDGPADYHLAVVVDITERKQAQEQRQRLEEQLQRSENLRSLGVLASGLAHDFNNLLGGIQGNMDLALLDLDATSPVGEFIAEARTASLRAADLIRQMLAYAGKGKTSNEKIDLSTVAREMAGLLRTSISKKAVLQLDLDGTLPAIVGDPTQVRQLIMNLITNAADAIGDLPGEIVVRTERAACDRASLDELRPDAELPEGDYLRLQIVDTGSGMSTETRNRIFEPFFTTKASGSGLGLAATHGIVRGHGGAIRVESKPGKGTVFEVLFPVAVVRTEAKSDEVGGVPEHWRGSGTVLLVDDEEVVRSIAAAMLQRLGFSVVTAEHGAEAVEVFLARHDEIDCVLLDSRMPHMGGEEAFDRLREIRGDVPVVLCSGFTEEGVVEQMLAKGLAGFLQKPYDLRALEKQLRAIEDL